ncbi:response regulator transcription factor [Rhizobium sp. EC-SD404]|uniref:response regulator transcription factor n=1 Tax=Rhizobium sp. EC-SD404 TaxID=2038389 RepID=UPI00125C0F65|nr:response regulator transcription factor [Rhizobium sp. EC-SD404]VVT07460.1 DNA-binding response regulator [Rhizobium sp. EC-SD404]
MKVERVLVIEDNARARQWMVDCVAVGFPGAQVSEASCLEDARRCLRNAAVWARAHGLPSAFDLVLIDIGLPDGSGIDLIEEINTSDSHCAPVITTIFDDAQQIFDAISAGARGYLLKHHDTDRFIQLMKRIIDDEPPLSPAVARHVMTALQSLNARMVPDAALTAREEEVLTLLGRGFQLSAVAKTLTISQNTASTHVKSIYRKLNIKTRAEAALAARDRGLLQREH